MAKYFPYVFAPKLSLNPSKISAYTEVLNRREGSCELHGIKSSTFTVPNRIFQKSTINNLKDNRHKLILSDNAYRSLKSKIEWMYFLAKSRAVKTYNGKDIFNFKMAFITLTLPSQQKECTKDFTNMYFNQFMTELRSRTKMENYVWRLEFQKNGNVHYHIATDTYLDYFFILPIWNRILSKGGYIADYKARFEHLSLSEYRNLVDSKKEKDFNKVAKAYAHGRKTKWEQPNSVDVKSVNNSQSISIYLSKYFAKSTEGSPIKNELDNSENTGNMRIWYCSRSLSKLKTLSFYQEEINWSPELIFEGIKSVRKKIFRYATNWYFNFKYLTANIKKFLNQLLKGYSLEVGYSPSG